MPRATLPRSPAVRSLAVRALASVAVLTGVGACSGSGSGATGAGSATTSASSAASPLTSFASVTAMAEQLNAKGVGCALEYEALHDEGTGRKEISLCKIDGKLAELTIWVDAASVPKFVQSAQRSGDVLAYGKEWTVSVKAPDLARRIASALGGAVEAPATTPST